MSALDQWLSGAKGRSKCLSIDADIEITRLSKLRHKVLKLRVGDAIRIEFATNGALRAEELCTDPKDLEALAYIRNGGTHETSIR